LHSAAAAHAGLPDCHGRTAVTAAAVVTACGGRARRDDLPLLVRLTGLLRRAALVAPAARLADGRARIALVRVIALDRVARRQRLGAHSRPVPSAVAGRNAAEAAGAAGRGATIAALALQPLQAKIADVRAREEGGVERARRALGRHGRRAALGVV